MQGQKLFLRMLFVGLASICMSPAWAAKAVNLRHYSAHSGLSVFKLAPLAELSRETDSNHITHVRYRQMYAGYPVWGGDVVVHTYEAKGVAQAKRAITLNGTLYEGIAADLKSTSDTVFLEKQKQQAIEEAIHLSRVGEGADKAIGDTESALMVYVDDDSKAHWAYRISFRIDSSHGIPVKPVYIMDATTLKVYETWDDIKTLDEVNGGGFGGNIKMGELIYDNLLNDYPVLDIRRDAAKNICYLKNSDVIVKDRRFGDEIVRFNCDMVNSEHNNVYWDADADSVNGGFSPSNDALYLGKVVKDMYQAWYHIPVLQRDGKPMVLTMRVHECDTDGKGLDNAYWENGQMTFGDGNKLFYPLTSLGVTAHEIAHGFTEQHSNLIYKRQSGGLNESFSDMAAQAAEFYTTQQNTWQIGADVTKADNQVIRYMDEPTKDCKGSAPGIHCSISSADDYYNGMNVHNSSGVFNKVFYLLSTSAGWDARKAFNVMVQANRYHWTPNSSFDDAACGVLRATQDLGMNTTAVVFAFAKVNIDTNDC